MADRKHGVPAAPTTSTMRADEWDATALPKRRFEAVLFTDVDLGELQTRGAVFIDCTFQGISFNASTHAEGAFRNCRFTRCSFFDVTFRRCKFVGSVFDGCRFGLVTAEGGDWSLVGLPGADLRRATFRDLRMREADLAGTRFDGATVRNVDLAGSWLHNASFHGADLRGSDLSGLDPLNTDVRDALIDVEQAMVIAIGSGLRIG